MDAYPNDVRIVHKHFPLSFHKNARPAAEAAHYALKEGKFWEMHELIFQNYRQLSLDKLKSLGQQAGLDPGALEQAVSKEKFKAIIDKDVQDGRKAAVT